MEHAAVLLNIGQVGQDGKTSYERLKGKPASLPGMQFGEWLLWRTNRQSPCHNFSSKGEVDKDDLSNGGGHEGRIG